MAKLTRENVPFTQIANAVLNDKKLSMKAKGLYAYLFSKPDTWDFSSNRMDTELSENRKTVQSVLRELERHGLLVRTRLSTGKMLYELKYSIADPKPEIRTQAPEAQAQKRLQGKFGLISNKESNNNNKELFDWNKTAAKMQEKEGSDMDIIATFLIEKKIVPANSAQLTGYIKRYRKVAKEIEPFVGKDFKKFWTAIDMCKEESFRLGYQWNLETVYKKITKI